MRRITLVLGLLALALPFTGAECTKTRVTDTVITVNLTSHWTTDGFTQGTDSDTRAINAADDLIDALDNVDADAVESISVSGVEYRLVANRGSAARQAAQHSGSVTFNSQELLTFNSPDTAPGTVGNPGNGRVVMKAAGVTDLNNRMNQFLASYKAGNPNSSLVNNLTFGASWASNPNASQADQDDFDWDVVVVLQIVATADVDIFAP